jgi:aerobic C4-dicarboxylate transport protein
LIGNAVATIVVARWEGALDVDRARRTLDGHLMPADADETKLYSESSDVDDRGAARHPA